ncbi:MAG: AbrB/MazE/SpoVT family DNA-binding domain-containing protein [Hyphomonadaceae bacterium]|nr:AbrB/MazE/SpoVT family DNA-binding domain-containing protein [Hyphomonadaceae bacterium]
MHIARWGNSLAVRIPAKMVKELALKEGDEVNIELSVVEDFESKQNKQRLEAIESLMNLPRFLPADFKFDREEANER